MRPMVISSASRSSWRCAPPRSVMTMENIDARLSPGAGHASSLTTCECYAVRVVRKKKKRGEHEDEDAPPKPAKVPEVGTGLKVLLERAGLATLPPPKPKRGKPASSAPAHVASAGSGKNAPQGSTPAPALRGGATATAPAAP